MKKLLGILAIFTLSACSNSNDVVKVSSLQKNDKRLSCNQVMLEINEAEYYRKDARAKKSPGIAVVVAPISYVADYMDADTAEVAADDRINYLNRIYEINKCDSQPVQQMVQAPQQMRPAQPMTVAQPVIQYVPVQQAPQATNNTGAYPDDSEDEASVVSEVSYEYELVPVAQAVPQYQQIAYVMPQQLPVQNNYQEAYLNYNY